MKRAISVISAAILLSVLTGCKISGSINTTPEPVSSSEHTIVSSETILNDPSYLNISYETFLACIDIADSSAAAVYEAIKNTEPEKAGDWGWLKTCAFDDGTTFQIAYNKSDGNILFYMVTAPGATTASELVLMEAILQAEFGQTEGDTVLAELIANAVVSEETAQKTTDDGSIYGYSAGSKEENGFFVAAKESTLESLNKTMSN